MPSPNYRGFTWTDEQAEHSEADELRAKLLSQKWSELHHAREQKQFRRQFDAEDGGGYEPDECSSCEGKGELGTVRDGRFRVYHESDCSELIHGIICPDCQGDGYDKTCEKLERERRIAEDLEIEVVEEMLEKMGARMMRPYEHWNEDERYMEYMERDR